MQSWTPFMSNHDYLGELNLSLYHIITNMVIVVIVVHIRKYAQSSITIMDVTTSDNSRPLDIQFLKNNVHGLISTLHVACVC